MWNLTCSPLAFSLECFVSTCSSLLETVVERFKLQYDSYTNQHLAAILAGFSLRKSPWSKLWRSQLWKTWHLIRIDQRVDVIEPESRQDPRQLRQPFLLALAALVIPNAKVKKVLFKNTIFKFKMVLWPNLQKTTKYFLHTLAFFNIKQNLIS